jgi:DNA-binding Xre family transcriptional regulator
MTISYKKLFKVLIDREIKGKELARLANVSPTTICKMKHDGSTLTIDVLARVALALGLTLNDIIDISQE